MRCHGEASASLNTRADQGSHSGVGERVVIMAHLVTAVAVLVVSLSALAGPATGQPVGLAAAYSFDEGAGTAVGDSSGNAHTGTITGATWTTTGRFGGALSFDGTNDWVTVADAASLDLGT